MPKYIVVVDGEVSTKYKFNFWSTHEYQDGAVSEDARKIEGDDLDKFLAELKEFLSKKEPESKT